MAPGPGFIVWCLLTMTASTLALNQPSRSEVTRIQPGAEVTINCNINVCGGSRKGDVLSIIMKKWIRAEKKMTALATLNLQNLTANSYDLQIAETVSKDMNITASEEDPVTLQISTSDMQTDDAYLCVVIYKYNLVPANVSCLTRLLVSATPAVPDSTTDATRGFTAPGHGGPPMSSPTAEQAATGSMSLMTFCVGLMAISLSLISAILILIILIYRKLGSRDLAQQTTEKAPPSDTLEKMVSNEAIYSVVKKQ